MDLWLALATTKDSTFSTYAARKEKVNFCFTYEHQNLYFHSWLPPLVKILILVSIRWNKIRSYTETPPTNILYLITCDDITFVVFTVWKKKKPEFSSIVG